MALVQEGLLQREAFATKEALIDGVIRLGGLYDEGAVTAAAGTTSAELLQNLEGLLIGPEIVLGKKIFNRQLLSCFFFFWFFIFFFFI